MKTVVTLRGVVLLLLGSGLISCSDNQPTVTPSSPDAAPVVSPAAVATQGAASARSAAPLVVSLEPAEPRSGDCVRLKASGHGSGRLSVRWELNGGLIDEGELLSLCAQPWVRGDVVTVYVTTETATASTSVTIANSPPGVVNVELKPPRLARNFDVTAIIAAQDPDSDKISTTCRWFINGSEVPGVTGTVLPGTQIHKGDQIVFEVVPSDGEIQGETFRSNTATVRNSAPSFASMPPERLSGFLYTYAARAIDPDDDPLTYTLEEGPPGMTIDEQSGKLEWQITLDNVGSYTVRIVASDTDGEKAEQEFPLRVGKVNE